MPQLVEMDRHVSLFEQMDQQQQLGPVILINTFTVEPHEAEQLQEAAKRTGVAPPRQEGRGSRHLRGLS
jgi:hypothetical protein